jgi:hypothetical protein
MEALTCGAHMPVLLLVLLLVLDSSRRVNGCTELPHGRVLCLRLELGGEARLRRKRFTLRDTRAKIPSW